MTYPIKTAIFFDVPQYKKTSPDSLVLETLITYPGCARKRIKNVGSTLHYLLWQDPTRERLEIIIWLMELLLDHGASPLLFGSYWSHYLTATKMAEQRSASTRFNEETRACYVELAKILRTHTERYQQQLDTITEAIHSLRVERVCDCIRETPRAVNLQDVYENTPLHWLIELYAANMATFSFSSLKSAVTGKAAERKEAICQIAQWLLDNGADLRIVNENNKTPLMLAEERLGRNAALTQIIRNHEIKMTSIASITPRAIAEDEGQSSCERAPLLHYREEETSCLRQRSHRTDSLSRTPTSVASTSISNQV